MKIPRKSVIEQLITYCDWAEQSTVYFKPKEQFDNRHKDAKKFLNDILETFDK